MMSYAQSAPHQAASRPVRGGGRPGHDVGVRTHSGRQGESRHAHSRAAEIHDTGMERAVTRRILSLRTRHGVWCHAEPASDTRKTCAITGGHHDKLVMETWKET